MDREYIEKLAAYLRARLWQLASCGMGARRGRNRWCILSTDAGGGRLVRRGSLAGSWINFSHHAIPARCLTKTLCHKAIPKLFHERIV